MGSGIEQVTLAEARGNIAPPPPIDNAAVVIGCASSAAVGLYGPFSSVAALNAQVGYGPGPTAVAYMIAEYGVPCALYVPPSTNPGTAAATVTAAITGSASGSAAVGGTPYDDYEVWWQSQGTAAVGTAMTLKWSLTNGRDQSANVNVGTGLTYGIPNSGVVITLGASGQTYANGDVGTAITTAPKWAAADLDTAGLPAGVLAQTAYDFAHIYLAGPCAAAEAGHVTTMLNNLKGAGKIVDATVHTAWPLVNGTQSEQAWANSVAADYLAFNDDRIEVVEGHKTRVFDPVTAQQWFRTWAYAYFAREVASERNVWAASPDDSGFTDETGTALVQLYDANNNLIGHDESPSGNVTGLSDAFGLGNRFVCLIRGQTKSTRRIVYTTVPWVAFTVGGTGRIFTKMQRRIAQAIERDALDVSFDKLGGTAFYTTDSNNVSTLTPEAQNAIHHVIFGALTGDTFADDIENSADDNQVTGLVQVQPVVTVSPGNLVAISVILAPKVSGKIITIALTYAAQ